MTADRTRIGDVELMSLCDSFLEFPASRLFPSVSAAAWEPYHGFLSPEDVIRIQVACFLIRSRGQTILVDTGIGAGPVEAFGGIRGRLPEELKVRGMRPEDVTQVFISHLHSDHVGWNLKKQKSAWRPFFPKARYSVARLDWEHFHKTAAEPNRAYLKETTTPLLELGIVDLLEGEKALTP
jgi:glyoxylase-like metal-dependent hydrolase (beta-lactamase superfamily II)